VASERIVKKSISRDRAAAATFAALVQSAASAELKITPQVFCRHQFQIENSKAGPQRAGIGIAIAYETTASVIADQ
jgi:hypothetical protein